MKKLIVFDLDGTLAESKSALDSEMSALLHDLLGIVKVAVISGGDWLQFEKQCFPAFPMIKAWKTYLYFLPAVQSSTNIERIGKRFILKISLQKKKRKLSVQLKRHSKHQDLRLKSYGERKLKTVGAR